MTAHAFDTFLREAEKQGSWAEYAVFCLGQADSPESDLNDAIAELYAANENVHRLANKYALRYEVDFFEGT